MGMGRSRSIYQARYIRYMKARGLLPVQEPRIWCFLGDGETDEPESLGSLTLAARENLDNLVWVVNCNLQRLDGPVRGNGKIIQELESVFRGAGWNVIKVIWGSDWDELLRKDKKGLLIKRMQETVDGEFRTRFHVPIKDEEIAETPFYRPPENSPEMKYLLERRKKLGGFLPKREVRGKPVPMPALDTFAEFLKGNSSNVSTTMSFVRLL